MSSATAQAQSSPAPSGDSGKMSREDALFHYLCHYEATLEFTSLKLPGRIAAIGAPFVPNSEYPDAGASPILEFCARHYALTDALPGFRSVKDDSTFWGGQVQRILESMAAACLSDSYDKGKTSKRKVLGMACSVFLAGISRGIYGGVSKDVPEGATEAEKLVAAWRRFKADFVYADMLDKSLALLKDGTPLAQWPGDAGQAAIYIKLTLASVLHYVFVESPDGEETTSILSRVHDKLPYWTIRQTVKVPYATSMVQGLTKILLSRPMFSKQSLLQSLISSVLGADQTRSEQGIKALQKKGLNSTHEEQINRYVYEASREQQQALRDRSMQDGTSIVAAILGTTDIKPDAHADLLSLLELSLARRDRVELIRILTADDTLPNAVNTFFKFFFPIIEELHRSVDLSAGIADMQGFLTDLIALSRESGSASRFYELVTKHESSFTRFANQILNKSPTLAEGYTGWYRHCLKAYTARQLDVAALLGGLPEDRRAEVEAELDGYAGYMAEKEQISVDRLGKMLDKVDADGGFGEWLGVLSDVQRSSPVTPRQPKTDNRQQIYRPCMGATTELLAQPFRDQLAKHVPK